MPLRDRLISAASGTLPIGRTAEPAADRQCQQQAAVEYGVGALVGGVTKFVVGRDVVDAARTAFSNPPDAVPVYLGIPANAERVDDQPNRPLETLEHAAKAVGAGVTSGATAVGSGAANAAGAVTRPFRRVDLDGDGVLDEPKALTAAKAPQPLLAEQFAHSGMSTETATESPTSLRPSTP